MMMEIGVFIIVFFQFFGWFCDVQLFFFCLDWYRQVICQLIFVVDFIIQLKWFFLRLLNDQKRCFYYNVEIYYMKKKNLYNNVQFNYLGW